MVLEIMEALPDFCAAVEADSMMLILDAWDGWMEAQDRSRSVLTACWDFR